MRDTRKELEHQVSVLASWLDEHAYSDYYTPKSAEKALWHIKQCFSILERRGKK